MMVGSLFSFDANTETPQDVARRRALAEAIMGRSLSPKNVGEGFSAMMDGVVANVNNSRASEAETLGRGGANDVFSQIVRGITGGSPAYSPTGGAMDAANDMGQSGGGMDAYRNAIASIESAGSGDYNAVGPTHETLGRALGKYQVMEANIGPWSKQVLGREISPDEFMANPQLQDAIFDGIFSGYVDQFGPEGAAQAWFAGPGGVGKMDRRDSLGTTVSAYTNKFNNALGGAGGQPAQVASLDPSIGIPAAPVQNPDSGLFDPEMAMNAPALPQRQTAQPQMAQPSPMQQPQRPQQVAQGRGLEELLMAAQNPWLEDSQRSILNTLIETELQKQDPSYQQGLEMGGLQIEQLRRELNAPNLMEVGGQLYNPDTGEWIAPPQAPAEPKYEIVDGEVVWLNSADQTATSGGQFGTPDAPTVQKVTLEDGSEMAVQWDGGSQAWVPINAPEGGGTLNTPGDLTESQSKLTLFQTMQTETQPVLLDLEEQFDPSNMSDAVSRSTPIAGNFFQSENGQIYNAAAAAWAEGALRVATGAAATPEEMERTRRTYFAQPGDTPNTIMFKAQMREMYNRAINNSLSQPSEGALPLPSEFAEEARGGAGTPTPNQSQPNPDVVDFSDYF